FFTVSIPFLPVNTLEIPEFTTSARALPCFKILRHQSTGTPGINDLVKTPATVVPGAKMANIKSSRFLYLMPQLQAARSTPLMGDNSGKGTANGETPM